MLDKYGNVVVRFMRPDPNGGEPFPIEMSFHPKVAAEKTKHYADKGWVVLEDNPAAVPVDPKVAEAAEKTRARKAK